MSENLTVILSFNFSKEELNSDLETDSSCFTALSLVLGLVSCKSEIKLYIIKLLIHTYI